MEIDQIAELCAAFEMGKHASTLGLSTIFNEFTEDSDAFYAWMIGHTVGMKEELFNIEEDFRPN